MRYDANGKLKPQQTPQRTQGRPASRYSGNNGSSHRTDNDWGGVFGAVADTFSGGGGSDCSTSDSSSSSSCGGGD